MKNVKSLVVACALIGSACTNPPADACTVEPPASWEAPDWDANTTEAIALRTQLDALVGDATMRGAETGEVTVDGVDDLTTPYAAGNPSIESITTPFFAGVVGDVFSEFLEITAAGPQDLVSDEGAWTPGDAGGIFGMSDRGINEGGLEVRQLADKGLFGGAALYNHALTLTEGEITPATIESLAALWGTNPTSNTEELTDSANYSHGMGYFAEIQSSLIAARAYAADEACGAERDAAVVAFFRSWEQSMFARFVYYANAGATGLGAAASDDDVAGGLHQLAEGVGLALGFRGVPHPASGPLSGAGRVVTDAQIDEMMSAVGVNVNDLGASTTGDFVTDPGPFADGVLEVESIAAEAFDLQSAEVEAWRNPTEG